jgi:hypothetical protein
MMSFSMALQQLTFIRDTTNRGLKEDFASPMNPEVVKILWHLSLYGSEIKIIIIIINKPRGASPGL